MCCTVQVVLPAWPAAAVAAAAGAAELSARRLGEALRLARNVVVLEGVLPTVTLQQLALGRVLGDRVVPFLHSIPPLEALPKAARAAAAIPDYWLQDAGGGGGVDVLLAPLRAVATSLASQLKGRARMGATEAPTGRRLLRLLTRLGDNDTARSVRRAFVLQDP